MTNILYIGNNLNSPQANISSIQTLGLLLESEGYTVRYSSGIRSKPLRLLAMLWATIKNKSWADVVLIDTYSTLNFYYAVLVSQCCRIMGMPYICCLNGGNLPMRLNKSAYLSKILFKHSKCNVAPSAYLKEAFQTHGYATRYIPNTIALNKYKLTQRNYTRIRLLWVRSFAEIYNPTLAINVQKHLIEKGYQTDLCMVGPDSDGTLAEAKELSEKLQTKTVFTGKLSKEAWIHLAEQYNTFINTTNFDNTPISVIEAMALGLPIVSTNVGGMPFLITTEVDGLLVEPHNSEKMAKAILRFMDNEDLREACILKARQKVEQFDWSIVRNQWHALLD